MKSETHEKYNSYCVKSLLNDSVSITVYYEFSVFQYRRAGLKIHVTNFHFIVNPLYNSTVTCVLEQQHGISEWWNYGVFVMILRWRKHHSRMPCIFSIFWMRTRTRIYSHKRKSTKHTRTHIIMNSIDRDEYFGLKYHIKSPKLNENILNTKFWNCVELCMSLLYIYWATEMSLNSLDSELVTKTKRYIQNTHHFNCRHFNIQSMALRRNIGYANSIQHFFESVLQL